ncbi:carbohydrate ABC transporter permease [Cohnella sp.]|uniref:carbohydrate ABC transporter permease n=1 Tax=Cohnella sp. TaxID=1883426 RepID=UPI0035667AE2
MGPALIMYVLIIVAPFILSLYYSMTDWNGVSSKIGWVGFENYKTIVTNDTDFARSFWFSTKITFVITILTNVLGFALAYLLMKRLKFRNVWRTVFFLPNVLGGLLLGFIWQFIFTKGFDTIGQLTNIPLFKLSWLGTEATAFWGLVIVSIWQGIGYVMVIYIAGLSSLSKEMQEAAEIDGANGFAMLFRIKLPMLMSSITVCFFLTINWTYKMFDLNFSLTNGGPFKSSQSVAFNIYVEAFSNNNYSLGTAKAVLFFLAVVLITSTQVYITKRLEVEA